MYTRTMDSLGFLKDDAVNVAPRLLGCIIEREINGKLLRGRIVEVEAYDETDAASHSYKGKTTRTEVMFGPSGHLYVYFTYGMHYCCNIVVGHEGKGSAVLIRAVEALDGVEIMRKNRGDRPDHELTNGPAKVCQAFAIDRHLNGHDLHKKPLQLIPQPPLSPDHILATPRIGISKAQDTLWRFVID